MASLINRARASAGMKSLRLNESLSYVARRHSARMASAGYVFHNSRLTYEPRNWSWRYLGESVGRGSSVYAVHTAFMRSDTHRARTLSTRYWHMGVGVV
jgi:uncharacterized protein YkwD